MKMKIPKLFSRKKLRATVARRSLRATAETYDDLSEPNMKLSRALLIVLVLHVVAVSGIIAFNAIKTRQDSFVRVPDKNAASPTPAPESTTRPDKVASKENTQPSHTSAKSVTKSEHKIEPAKATDHALNDSGKVYVVVKGDNPVTIARRLKVSYDDLIGLNHIDDPRKLQIGQKLLIPKAAKTRKTNE